MRSCLVAALLLVVLLESQLHTEASPSGMGSGSSDTSSIPILASGKRQHNIMRFGKRPSSGHSLIHFGKREEEGPAPTANKGHSFLYFGKRSIDQDEPSSFWDYFQKSNRDGSYKRGHSIMRFGKRGAPPDTHSFIRFGRQIEDDEDLDKRTGHSMMYFGKRGANTNNAGHSMMYFGKRGANANKAGHSMMYFGKRGSNGHSMMYFGKRDDGELEDEEDNVDKRAHAMIHFGKRDIDEEKRAAHSMIHFGKRGEDPRKGSHAMIHFGKRDFDEEDIDDEGIDGYWSPQEVMKRQHNLLRFGKKMDGKGSHAMIHFGKRELDEDKRAHSMIHFGKRSAEEEAVAGNRSDKEQPLSRMKREVEPVAAPLMTLVRYDDDDEAPASDESLKQIGSVQGFYGPWDRQEEEWEPNYLEYGQPDKKESVKNAFLRFG